MALFNKLFSTHKRKNVNASPANTSAKQFPFTNEQVRILLYRECDWRGRRLLFDSTAVQQVHATKPAAAAGLQFGNLIAPPSGQGTTATAGSNGCDAKKHPSYIDTVNGISYRYAQPAESDFNDIGEMVFGSVAMSVRATTLKVHWLPEPTRFLCSQVFVTPAPGVFGTRGSRAAAGHSTSGATLDNSSMDTSSLNSFSLSVSVCVSERLDRLAADADSSGDSRSKLQTHPLDVPDVACAACIGPTNCAGGGSGTSAAMAAPTSGGGRAAGSERNLAYSDSGYGGTEPWTSSGSSYFPFNSSTRSSFGSVFSDRGCGGGDQHSTSRKFSTDSAMTEATATTLAVGTAGDGGGGGIQRRILRNVTTSFENRRSMSDCVGFIGDQQPATSGGPALGMSSLAHLHAVARGYPAPGSGSETCVTVASGAAVRTGRRSSDQAEQTYSNPEMMRRGRGATTMRTTTASGGGCGSGSGSSKRAKLGLAICIQLTDSAEAEMQTFCSEHMVLLESMLCRLRATAETAYANQKRFYQLMLHAWMATAEWLVDLFTAPRLVEPVWLALSGGYAHDAKQLAQGFMQELCWLLNCADTKDSNFFISTLLTAILTHHLGWVGTVAPLTDQPCVAGNRLTSAAARTTLPAADSARMADISRFHPYNVLWAQMSDLYGAIGSPPKVSKTIVCGTEKPLIGKVLNVLTYFIRCGQIERDIRAEVFEKQVIDDILDDFVGCSTSKATGATERPTKTVVDTDTVVVPNDNVAVAVGLTRSATCLRALGSASAMDDDERSSVAKSSLYGGSRKNDIPNVLIFRDSRFVQQELRIGNFLMDTGIEMTAKQRQAIHDYRVKQTSTSSTTSTAAGSVRVLVTSPTAEELSSVGNVSSTTTDDTVEEATEMLTVREDETAARTGTMRTSPSLSDLITANSMGSMGDHSMFRRTQATAGGGSAAAFLWGIEPIKEGVSVEQWQHIAKGIKLHKPNDCLSDGHDDDDDDDGEHASPVVVELKRTRSLFTKSTNVRNVDRIRRSKSRRSMAQPPDGSGDAGDETIGPVADETEDWPATPSMLKSYPSLSDLITANSCGASERLTWGIEPVKESVTLDEVHHFENSQKRIDERNTLQNQSPAVTPNVVFVLGGDNETLANLKSSLPKKSIPPTQPPVAQQHLQVPQPQVPKKKCSHKKHSGVKFNFEKYPQIATNYMKNKNIDLAHYDFTGPDKALMKLNGATGATSVTGASSSASATTVPAPSAVGATEFPLVGVNGGSVGGGGGGGDSGDDSDGSECECCGAANATRTLLQTPSNATELEFSNDDSDNYPTSTAAAAVATTTAPDRQPPPPPQRLRSAVAPTTQVKQRPTTPAPLPAAMTSIRLITLPMSKHQLKSTTSSSADALKSAAADMPPMAVGVKSTMTTNAKQQTLVAPMRHPDNKCSGAQVVRPAGFIPSLFVGITDHYVADMVLQGTTAPLSSWEHNLKQNLSLAAHCATLEPRITENVAILANTDKWDVKVVSSQTYVLPCGSGTSGPIGMSQLVATMLETVNAMWSAGLPAYQCMAYMEAKLQELYLQSETLAAFLLATEFCSLSTVTAALNLSANDVPLLLSVASVHSPQVTQKYGVSFR